MDRCDQLAALLARDGVIDTLVRFLDRSSIGRLRRTCRSARDAVDKIVNNLMHCAIAFFPPDRSANPLVRASSAKLGVRTHARMRRLRELVIRWLPSSGSSTDLARLACRAYCDALLAAASPSTMAVCILEVQRGAELDVASLVALTEAAPKLASIYVMCHSSFRFHEPDTADWSSFHRLRSFKIGWTDNDTELSKLHNWAPVLTQCLANMPRLMNLVGPWQVLNETTWDTVLRALPALRFFGASSMRLNDDTFGPIISSFNHAGKYRYAGKYPNIGGLLAPIDPLPVQWTPERPTMLFAPAHRLRDFPDLRYLYGVLLFVVSEADVLQVSALMFNASLRANSTKKGSWAPLVNPRVMTSRVIMPGSWLPLASAVVSCGGAFNHALTSVHGLSEVDVYGIATLLSAAPRLTMLGLNDLVLVTSTESAGLLACVLPVVPLLRRANELKSLWLTVSQVRSPNGTDYFWPALLADTMRLADAIAANSSVKRIMLSIGVPVPACVLDAANAFLERKGWDVRVQTFTWWRSLV